jgi:integrase
MGKLTDAAIRQAKPKDKPYRRTGDLGQGLPGRLICRVEPSGAKRLFFRYRTGGADHMKQLGLYDSRGGSHGLTLSAAHEMARQLSNRLKTTPNLKVALELEKRDEQAARRQLLRDRQDAETQSLQRLLDVYVAHLEQQKKGAARDVRNLVKLHVSEAHPDLAGLPAAAIVPRDIAGIVRVLVEEGKERTAGKLRSYVGAAFALALTAETNPKAPADALGFGLTINPARATAVPSGVRSRNRVLSVEELKDFMSQAGALPAAQGDALALLLLLCGQRPAQLLRAKVSDVDAAAKTLRLFDTKGKRREPRQHVLPLSQSALEIISRRAEAAKTLGCEWLFSTDGEVPIRLETLSEQVKRISDARINAKNESELRAKREKHGYQMRDIRRTCETMLAQLGISRDTRAQLLSHGLSGVQQQHYDRHDYMDEKRAALTAWEQKLREVREGKEAPSNVTQIRPKLTRIA